MTEAILHTTHGDIAIHLFDEIAPITVGHFLGLVKGELPYKINGRGTTEGPFYDGTGFHTVLKTYLIQGGDPTGTGRGDAGVFTTGEYPYDLTFNQPYRVAFVNRGPGTNSCQFVITLQEMEHLNGQQPIFGEIADPIARSVVNSIAELPTDRMTAPLTPVVINNISLMS